MVYYTHMDQDKAKQLQNAEKIFCDRVEGGFTQEFFVMAMASGAEEIHYALTPQHLKRLSQWLKHQVDNYEKEHGTINAEWSPNMKSPFQLPSDDNK